MTLDLDEVAQAIGLGDRDAFAWWLARAEPALRRSLARFATQVDVEAVLQEALLRLWQVASRFQPDGRPNGLLRLAQRIAHNLAIDAVRRTASERDRDESAEQNYEQTTDPIEPDPLLREAVERCHAALPERPRTALDARLHAEGGLPDRALAEGLGIRVNTFLQNVTRARQLLVECLANRGIRLEEVWR